MAVVGEHVSLKGKKSAGGIGDVDAVQAAALGNGLGPHVLFEGDGKIRPGLYPAVVGKNHGPVAVDLSQAGDHPGAGNVVDAGIVHAEPGDSAQFKKRRLRVHQLLDELSHRLFALGSQALHRLFATRPKRLVNPLVEFFLLRHPVSPIVGRRAESSLSSLRCAVYAVFIRLTYPSAFCLSTFLAGSNRLGHDSEPL